LDVKDWSAERKAKVAEVLTMDFMSSEESDTDESGTTVYKVKSLSWQSQELTRRKKSLEKHHLDSLSDLTRRRLTAR
jgi:hypothetical protein